MDVPLKLFTIAFLSSVILISLDNLTTIEPIVEEIEEPPSKKCQLIEAAQQYRGTKYRSGGMSPKKGFDCSGFTQFVFREIDMKIARSAKDQAKQGVQVELNNVEKGDLLFFARKKRISHVGIVISDIEEPLTIIHASSSQGVITTNVEKSKYWKSKIKVAKRFF